MAGPRLVVSDIVCARADGTPVARWIQVIDLQPSASASSTNHTGALLVSLLSCPFRGKEVTSIWHHQASTEDLDIWDALLEVTVKRFRAKRVGSNFGVLESLAGHLSDYLNEGEKTRFVTLCGSCGSFAADRLTAHLQSPSLAWPVPLVGSPLWRRKLITLLTSPSAKTLSPSISSASYQRPCSSRILKVIRWLWFRR